jgi:hypothetical protein
LCEERSTGWLECWYSYEPIGQHLGNRILTDIRYALELLLLFQNPWYQDELVPLCNRMIGSRETLPDWTLARSSRIHWWLNKGVGKLVTPFERL